MAINKKNLQVWAGNTSEEPSLDGLPTASEALYAGPNPDGTRKRCGNCVQYATRERSCYLHDPKLVIEANEVCGYFVFGSPMEEFQSRVQMEPLDPEMSGLVETKEGASCDLCAHYDDGACRAVRGSGEHHDDLQRVDPKGCCTRWIASSAE